MPLIALISDLLGSSIFPKIVLFGPYKRLFSRYGSYEMPAMARNEKSIPWAKNSIHEACLGHFRPSLRVVGVFKADGTTVINESSQKKGAKMESADTPIVLLFAFFSHGI